MADEGKSGKENLEDNATDNLIIEMDSATPKRRGRKRKNETGDMSNPQTTPAVSNKRANVDLPANSTDATPTSIPNGQSLDTPARKRGRPPKTTPSTGKKVGRPRKNREPEDPPSCDEQLPEPATPVISRRGRVIKTPVTYQASTKSTRRSVTCHKENEDESIDEDEPQVDTPAGKKEECSRVSPEEKEARRRKVSVKVKTMKNVICGVCKKEMLEPNFIYHRYSVHHGLARLEGQSQEFTEQEKATELRKTLEKLKKLHCKSCSSAFTTVLGYQYHIKRCGKDLIDLEEMLQECSVCGKKVMSLAAHLKTHEKRAEPICENKEERVVGTPEGKSKRAAAVKATTLIREFKEELTDAQPKESVKKALKFLMAPPSQKVSNSIIAAWKKQISSSSKGNCRYPSCEFSSDDIEKLKEHHVTCDIGAKTQVFGCLKCSFQNQERREVLEHIQKNHVVEAEFEPVDASSSSEEEDESGDDEGDLDEEKESENGPKNKTVPHNSKFLDKAYGLSQNVLSLFKSMLNQNIIPNWLARYHKRQFTWDSSLFTDWKSKHQVVSKTPQEYLPNLKQSILFARRGITVATSIPEDLSYRTLKRFEGIVQDCTPVFFCGGPIASAAWCPMPLNIYSNSSCERDQYLALSVFQEEDQFRSAMLPSVSSSKYLIQIWNCGKLPALEPAPTIPKLALCLVHDFGRVWSLKWCPSGCYDSERLGVLAAAFADGTIRCFSIPNPSSFDDPSSAPIYLKLEACITLKLKTNEGSECTCLNWDDTKGHRFIVGGFSNGAAAIWNLKTKSPLLSTGDTLYPIWSFLAHSSVVTAISLDPHHGNARFLATASLDRTVKLWDRNDYSMPVSCTKRSRVTDIKWRRHWPGVTVSVDDFCALFRSSSMFYDFGYTGNRQGVLPQNSVAWSVAENEFLDIIAHSTDAGEVVVYPSHFAVIDCDEKKLRKQRKVIFRTDLVNTESKKILNRMQKIYSQSTKKATTGLKCEEALLTAKNYALIFNESVNRSGKHFGTKQPYLKAPASDAMDVLLPNDEPHTSIKSIAFNPNFESHTWMCVCGENGLVHLLRVETQTLTRVADNYMKGIKED